MRIATLKTEQGTLLAGVTGEDSSPQFWNLAAGDAGLPRCLSLLLAMPDGLQRAAAAMEAVQSNGSPVLGQLLAPIPRPGKVLCIGLNYRDHAEESGMAIPNEPVCFSKFSSCVIGPQDEIRLPSVSKKVDYEAELVAVIGQGGRNISTADAMKHVAGYMNGNDVSARDWQAGRPGGQWLLGKTPDTFAPLGPWLVTADEIADPHQLGIRLRLNGELMQDSSTSQLIFKLPELIAHVSQLITLEPGDVIFTGTPPGVGMARKPPVFLQDGDVVEVEIDGLGVLHNSVVAGD
ncbi:MAG: fumarylacetoacetate hydrolase family protein [Planctomycetaceae bacterium]|nr:fumarylacetoacetate hydrolase family protein [Planctomycetaceae bacterium]